MMSQNNERTLNHFPFYEIDHTTWNQIKNKPLNDVWMTLEKHVSASIVSNEVELLQLISLDKEDRLIDSRIIAVGTIDHIHAKIRYIAENALKTGVFGIVLAHNHTSGNTIPSWNDITYTKSLNHAFHLLDIALVDHLIVAPDAVFSMRRNCLIF